MESASEALQKTITNTYLSCDHLTRRLQYWSYSRDVTRGVTVTRKAEKSLLVNRPTEKHTHTHTEQWPFIDGTPPIHLWYATERHKRAWTQTLPGTLPKKGKVAEGVNLHWSLNILTTMSSMVDMQNRHEGTTHKHRSICNYLAKSPVDRQSRWCYLQEEIKSLVISSRSWGHSETKCSKYGAASNSSSSSVSTKMFCKRCRKT